MNVILRVPLLACLALLLPPALVPAQQQIIGSVRATAGSDPYTEGEADALAKAGYVSYGPFPFGYNHTTREVDDLLGTEPLIWIETAHFRLGCALPAVRLKKGEEWSKQWLLGIKRELKQLRKVLPHVKRNPKVLDPWLRAHLFALRLEKLYAQVEQQLRQANPEGHGANDQEPAGTGHGPFLGMDEKFAVLLLQQESSHARYTRAFQGVEMADPIRFHDPDFDCMYWGASEETSEGLLRSDLAMHAHLTFNVAHNLYSGYRGYRRALPPWLVTGLAHWHARRISPRFPVHDRRDDDDQKARSAFWQWAQRAAGLAKNGAFEQLDAFVMRVHAGDYGVEQHIQAWALVDFLLATRATETFRFLHLAKQSGLARDDAFEQAFGCRAAELDGEWRSSLGRRRR